MNGTACKLTASEGSTPYDYPNLLLYDDVLGDHQCYFGRGSASYIIGILGSNSAIGSTVPFYRITNGDVTPLDGTVHVDSSTPSDYYTNVIARNFTLTQRS